MGAIHGICRPVSATTGIKMSRAQERIESGMQHQEATQLCLTCFRYLEVQSNGQQRFSGNPFQKRIPGQGKPIDISACVQLNKEVIKIAYDLNDSSVPIRIECDDGSAYEADHVICTVSLGVLKERHLFFFDPILPQKKIDTIESMAFGVVDKMILEFELPFWPDDWSGCLIIWDAEQLKLIRENEESRWLEDVIAFHRIDYQPNVLLAWIQGASARQMELFSTTIVSEQCMMLLRMVLKDFDIPDRPKNCIR